MRLLLDTHALLWWLAGDPRLSQEAQDAIREPSAAVAVSAASIWEIAIKAKVGRLRVPADFADRIAETPLEPLSITHRHAFAAGALPLHHDDPFDRILIAQAQLEGMTVVTRDRRFAAYAVALLPA